MIIYWVTCDHRGAGKPCLFRDDAKRERCIRHGALLFGDSTLDGKSRDEANKILRARDDTFHDYMAQ
jgi:hypothetical protein